MASTGTEPEAAGTAAEAATTAPGSATPAAEATTTEAEPSATAATAATAIDDAATAPAAPPDPRNEDVLRRLKSVEGHVRGVERMVREDAYCIDVLNQILAVQRALEKVSGLVLDRHLHHCVTRAMRSQDPDERERVIEEIMDVFGAKGRS